MVLIIFFSVVFITLWNKIAYYLHNLDCLSIFYKIIKCKHKYNTKCEFNLILNLAIKTTVMLLNYKF